MPTASRRIPDPIRTVSALPALACILLAVLACNLSSATPTPAAGSAASDCLAGITPGTTTKNEVLARLGNPLDTIQEGSSETLQYASGVYGQSNSIMLSGGLVGLVTVVELKPPSWGASKAQLGEPTFSAYSGFQPGAQVFAFPERGRALIADPLHDAVLMRQCFAPTSLAAYSSTFGKDYPSQDPFVK